MAAVAAEDMKVRLTCRLRDLWDTVVNIGSVRNISGYRDTLLVCRGKTMYEKSPLVHFCYDHYPTTKIQLFRFEKIQAASNFQ